MTQSDKDKRIQDAELADHFEGRCHSEVFVAAWGVIQCSDPRRLSERIIYLEGTLDDHRDAVSNAALAKERVKEYCPW